MCFAVIAARTGRENPGMVISFFLKYLFTIVGVPLPSGPEVGTGADGGAGAAGAMGNQGSRGAVGQPGSPGPPGPPGIPATAPPILYGPPPGKPWPAGNDAR